MNIKSLLLGSAAAMVTVPMVQAADAVVVEPEPVEYVRVCDAYGSGFFFIPGTETCLRFSGYVRSVFSHTETTITGTADASVTAGSTEDWANRARFGVDTRSETDWGTLRGFFRIDTDIRGSGGDAAVIDRAVVSLGGLRVGQTTNYWTSNHGFAGIDLSGIAGEDGPFFGATTAATLFDYTWAADGLAITGGVQYTSEGGDISSRALATAGSGATTAPNGAITSLGTPAAPATGNLYDYYIGVNYSADFGSIAATYIVDGNGGQGAAGVIALGADAPAVLGAQDGDAWKVSATLDLSEFVPGGTLHAMYMDAGDDLVEHVQAGNFGVTTESIWSVGMDMNLSDELVLAANYYDFEQAAIYGGGEGDLWGVGLTWRPAAAPGLKVYATYFDQESTSGANSVETDGWAFEIRRSF